MSDVVFSLVLPAYNEADDLSGAVISYLVELEKFFGSKGFELIIVEDGCSDGTTEKSRFLSKKFDEVKHIHFDERQGRGLAVTKAFEDAKGSYYAYSDVDFSNYSDNLRSVVQKLDIDQEVIVGTRVSSKSNFERKNVREFLSRYYNKLAKILLDSKVSDHQCGLKVFDAEAFDLVIDEVKSNHWSWDTEILYEAQRKNLNLVEVPISGKESQNSTVKPTDPLIMGLNLLWMRFLS